MADDTEHVNTVRKNCVGPIVPHLCGRRACLEAIISGNEKDSRRTPADVRVPEVLEDLSDTHKSSLSRALADVRQRSAEKALESQRKIEDFIQCLNAGGQYGVLLYHTGELVVPGTEKEWTV